MIFSFKQVPVKTKDVLFMTETTKNKKTESTIARVHTFDSSFTVPAYLAISNEKVIQVCKNALEDEEEYAITILMVFVSQIRTFNSNIVHLTLQEIKDKLNISFSRVQRTVCYLTIKGILEKVSNGVYAITPELAWYGDTVSWAEILKESKEQKTLNPKIIVEISKQELQR